VIKLPACSAINHLLEGEEWARSRLKAHQGKTALIKAGGTDFGFRILDSGLIELAETGNPSGPGTDAVENAQKDAVSLPALTITLPPASLLAVVRGEEGALKNVDVRGDADLAQTVLFLVANLRWDVEEDLARLIGDIAAHRLVTDVRAALAWERDARARFAASVGDYLTTEAEVLTATEPIASFAHDVTVLSDELARLEQRLARLHVGNAGKNGGKTKARAG
jgi:ubiquinone biosynthesis protein UbiJ